MKVPLLLRNMMTREFWTSFSWGYTYDLYYGDGSQRRKLSLTGFFRNVEISYLSPWDRRVGE